MQLTLYYFCSLQFLFPSAIQAILVLSRAMFLLILHSVTFEHNIFTFEIILYFLFLHFALFVTFEFSA